MKAVILSTQPKWCEKITNKIGIEKDGKPIYEKTVEIRKTRPKIETPFKCYIYATKNGDRIVLKNDRVIEISKELTGKVIGEFVCRKIDFHSISDLIVKEDADKALDGTCLGKIDVLRYIGYPSGTDIYAKPYEFYGWHISDLVIYDTPKELGKFFKACDKPPMTDCSKCIDQRENVCKRLSRPPQSWGYVEGLE